MYKYKPATPTTLKRNTSYIGERIEEKINRILNNKEPITDGAPIVYTERKDGVKPEYNIKTDRWEIAVDAMSAVEKTYQAMREQRIKDFTEKMQKHNDKTNQQNNSGTNQNSNQGNPSDSGDKK